VHKTDDIRLSVARKLNRCLEFIHPYIRTIKKIPSKYQNNCSSAKKVELLHFAGSAVWAYA